MRNVSMTPRLEKSIELYNILLRRGYLEPFCDEVSKKLNTGLDGTMPEQIFVALSEDEDDKYGRQFIAENGNRPCLPPSMASRNSWVAA